MNCATMVSYGILALMLAALSTVATGEVYKVGDSAGWTNDGHPNYDHWASAKTFRVGDIIQFEYKKESQNVVRVTHKNFRACNGTAPYAALSSGVDSFTIRKTGHFYFICSLPGHCEAGQKVDIRVVAAIAAPPKSSLPPMAPLPFPPIPVPSAQPVPSPAPSSVPVPSPAPSSVHAPSPAPSSVHVPSPAPSSVLVPSPVPSAHVPPPAPSSVHVPSPAPSSAHVPPQAPPSVPVPSPSALPSVPVLPQTPSPSPTPPADLSPPPSSHKNGSGKYSVNSWLTVVATVFGVLVFSF